MITRLLLAWLHLLALSIGLSGVWSRARALRDSLRNPEDPRAINRAYTGDMWWGIAAGLWLITGVWRLVAHTEKNTGYYFSNHVFLLKMALFIAIVALEIWPMKTLMQWRTKKADPNPRDAGRIEIISYVQCAMVVAMVLAAVTMARGYGMRTTADASVSANRNSTIASVNGAPASAASSSDSALDDAPDPVEPSGTETVTGDDVALLTREIAMPLDGVDPARLHSNFDERRGGGTRPHQALDMMAPRRTPVHSAAKGRVLKLFTSANGGLMVYAADSSERFVLMYAHLDSYAPGLRDGMPLERGQLVGYVGSSGNASPNAPHLHFAIARSADVTRWSKGKPIDPLPILAASALANAVR